MQKFKWSHLVVLLFFIISAGYLSVLSITQPFLGIDLEKQGDNWVITHIDMGSWADRENIPIGSSVSSIEGNAPEDHFSVSMFEELELANSFTIQTSTQPFVYENIEQKGPLHWTLFIIIPILFFLSILAIAYLVHKRVPKRYSANQLIIFFLTIATGYLSNSGAVRDDLYSIFLNTSLFLVAPVILMHFLYNYFQELNIYWFSKKIVYSLYFFVIAVSSLEGLFLYSHNYPDAFGSIPGWLLMVLYTFLFSVIYKGLYIYKESPVGSIFKYMSVGMTVAFFPYIWLYLVPALLFGVKIISIEVGAFFLVALPITFIYLITRERLIDINFVISRVRYYALLSIIPSLLLTLGITWLMEAIPSEVTYVQIYLLIHICFIMFLSIKEVLDFRLQRYLFSARYSYQESMHRMSKDMKDQSNAVDLMKVMRDEIRNVMNVKEIYIYSKHNKKNMYCVYDQIPDDILKHFDRELISYNYDIGSIIETEKGFGVIVGYSLEKLTMLWCKGKKIILT
ncbi:two-component system, NarL family, sensor histidine kinase ComP [Halobacillus alkaliphilus]|uniref:Two-component system, NarL family, sensor histidine kinase ComP n=1 Tax=Halobacillus alkaliphilus TaxID=396056 RepID=A0A1I2SZS0_9BACI|nr:hypothetical protein [Halobacillus alkaliphilus]SFG58305.1 two-component system, NarL family, sensor histidine kinase ComP [Halobacillus alkaliphilus]